MPPKPTVTNEPTHLLTTTTQTHTLLLRFLSALDTPSPVSTTPVDFSPLTLLSQSSSLIRAHTTKLSLLLLNKPFTPSAIRKVLEQMTKEALPGMAAGVQLVQGMNGTYGGIMVEEVVVRVRRVYRELVALVEEVVVMVKCEGEGVNGDGEGEKKNRDTLASTGVLWAACDAIVELERMGVPGLLVKKVGLWREMLEDAIAELREWSEGAEDDEDDDDEDEDEITGSDEEDESSSTSNSLEALLNTTAHLPKSRSDLKATLELALKQLKLTSTLYAAITKRRLKTLVINTDTPSSTLTKVDALMEKLKQIPEDTDELASAFYDLDDEEARRVLEGVCGLGRECIEVVRKGWEEQGEEDEFTKWCGKWIEAVGKEPEVDG